MEEARKNDELIIKKVDDYILANDEYHRKQDELHRKNSEVIASIYKGLYGDPEMGEKGLKEDMKPILEAWKSTKWIFGALIAFGSLALMVKSLFFK